MLKPCPAPALQCVTAVEPEWLAELGPMFFSVRRIDEGRLDARKKAEEHKTAMELEFKAYEERKRAEEAARAGDVEAQRARERAAIVTPGLGPGVRGGATPMRQTPRRVGL